MTPREALTAVTSCCKHDYSFKIDEALAVLNRLVSKDEAEALHASRQVMVIGRPDSRTPVNAETTYMGSKPKTEIGIDGVIKKVRP